MKQLFFAILITIVACNSNNTPGKAGTTPVNTTGQDSLVTGTASQSNSVPADSVASARLIIPGHRIGLTEIGEPLGQLIKILGKPDKEDAAMGKAMATWYSGKDNHETDIFAATDMGAAQAVSRVKQVRVTSPYFLTAGRLGVGAGLDAIQRQFPSAYVTGQYTVSSPPRTIFIYDDTAAGIAFETDSITQKCIAIGIHAPGTKVYDNYLGFFDNYRPR